MKSEESKSQGLPDWLATALAVKHMPGINSQGLLYTPPTFTRRIRRTRNG